MTYSISFMTPQVEYWYEYFYLLLIITKRRINWILKVTAEAIERYKIMYSL